MKRYTQTQTKLIAMLEDDYQHLADFQARFGTTIDGGRDLAAIRAEITEILDIQTGGCVQCSAASNIMDGNGYCPVCSAANRGDL